MTMGHGNSKKNNNKILKNAFTQEESSFSLLPFFYLGPQPCSVWSSSFSYLIHMLIISGNTLIDTPTSMSYQFSSYLSIQTG
jgi:hypothetical protein